MWFSIHFFTCVAHVEMYEVHTHENMHVPYMLGICMRLGTWTQAHACHAYNFAHFKDFFGVRFDSSEVFKAFEVRKDVSLLMWLLTC